MNNDIEFTFASSDDLSSIKELLRKSGLPHEDVNAHLRHFIVAKDGGALVGVVGLEKCGEVGLLRSLAVTNSYQRRGIARNLYARILDYTHSQAIKKLFLLTTTAEGFFSKMGFARVERDKIPESIRATKEFQSLCPSTAICMTKNIDKDAK